MEKCADGHGGFPLGRLRVSRMVALRLGETGIMLTRREVLLAGAATTVLAPPAALLCAGLPPSIPAHPIATNTYPWSTFARRDGQTLTLHTDALLHDIGRAGFGGYEPVIHDVDEFEGLKQRLTDHGLEMPSLYVNSRLHDATQSQASIHHVLALGAEAKRVGTKIIVTNPDPIRWGGNQDKSDQQLRHQAESLNQLGRRLRQMGLTLAYHNHDSELRKGAREFHHMLTATDPEHVKFCLDAHWIYRGCGNSQVALFDTVERYADRIVELHLRQSRQGVWSETFSVAGDIDYLRLLKLLAKRTIRPHFVLEQAVEQGSAKTMDVVAAHRKGLESLRSIWK